MKALRKLSLLVAILAALGSVPTVAAAETLEIEPGTLESGSFNADGSPSSQAGAHPFISRTRFMFKTEIDSQGSLQPKGGQARNIEAQLPSGFVGNPRQIPRCTSSQLAGQACPPASQVGMTRLFMGGTGPNPNVFSLPVYNVVPSPGYVAEFAYVFVYPEIHVLVSVRDKSAGSGPPDYGVTATVTNISQILPLVGSDFILWGNPADPAHDAERRGIPNGGVFGFPSGEPPFGFLSNGTRCGVPEVTTVRVDTWQASGIYSQDSTTSPPLHGCDRPPFKPTISIEPESRSAGAPSGLSVELRLPHSTAVDGLNTSPLRNARVTLPEGVTINPASAEGLAGCTDAQLGIGSGRPTECPAASKIGEAEAESPALDERLHGGIYLLDQASNDPESGRMYRLALVLENEERGLEIKLPGEVRANARSGRLETVFSDNPQLPASAIDLQFKGGPRAPLSLPARCGSYETSYSLTSWSGRTVTGSVPMTIDRDCEAASSFTPGLEAGTADPVAGHYSDLLLRFTRPDGQPNLSQVEARLPAGLLAKLADVSLCGDAQAATADCPAGSRIGTTTVGVGGGASPLFVPQPGKAATAVYLAGPYRGAPYSAVVKVPAQAGPFDLGTVAVRNALYVDPVSAAVTVRSDPLPQILQGIPVAYRDVRVRIDRPRFAINPTNCAPMEVGSILSSSTGLTASPSSRFQVADCAALGFKPKLALLLRGGEKRGAYPALTAKLRPRVGDANIEQAVVTLPRSEFLAQEHIKTVCTRVQYNADACPQGSVYGMAEARTPLLDKPLKGPVHLRANGGERKLPDLVADLNGQIEIDLVGYIDSVNGGIRTRFQSVPDAPVSSFTLRMKGGKKSLLVNSRNLCAGVNRAQVRMTAHNGKVHTPSPALGVKCGKRKK